MFGLFRPNNHCLTYCRQANINTAFLIECLNHFCQFLSKPTVLIIDNAPTHDSRLFKEQLQRWQEKDLFIFFLPLLRWPKYSPHLNITETFWREVKYEWPQDYRSFAAFKDKINHIFNKASVINNFA